MSQVTDMNSMFARCPALTTIDLCGWNTAKVWNMNDMFSNSPNISKIYVSERWKTSAVTASKDMFKECTKLPNFNASVTDKTNAHYNTGGYLTYKAAPTT